MLRRLELRGYSAGPSAGLGVGTPGAPRILGTLCRLLWGGHSSDSREVDFDDADATLGDLRSRIEQEMSVAKVKQQLICAGRRWQGIAFDDGLKLCDAAGSKGLKEVDGVKAISVMLMAPAGVDGTDEVSRCEAQVDEAREIIAKLSEVASDDSRKAALLAQDLLVKASTALDSLDLVGAQRERRRDLLKKIEAVEQEIEAKKKT